MPGSFVTLLPFKGEREVEKGSSRREEAHCVWNESCSCAGLVGFRCNLLYWHSKQKYFTGDIIAGRRGGRRGQLKKKGRKTDERKPKGVLPCRNYIPEEKFPGKERLLPCEIYHFAMCQG